MQVDHNKNAARANEKLDVDTINKLGLSRDEFRAFSGPKPNEPQEYIEVMPEMVVAKIKHDATLLNMEKVDRFPVKKGEYYLMRMINFIQLYNKDRVEPTHFFKKYYKSYKGENLNNKCLFVWVYQSGFGDLLFQQAILRDLKRKYPRVFITFAVPTHQMQFVQSWGTVDRVVSNITSVNHFLNADYHLNFEFVIRAKKGFEENVDRNFATRASIKDFSKGDAHPQIPVNPEYRRFWIKELDKRKIKDFIILNYNSGNPMRIPRPKFRIGLLNKLIDQDYNIVFIDSLDKYEEIRKLIRSSKNPKKCFNFIKKSDSIVSSTSLVSLAKCVVSVDTGLAHIATAVGTPLYGIYGPFHGYIRVSTYPDCKWVDSDLECAPCLEHDLENCTNSKNGYPLCYDKYDQDKMVEEIKTLIKPSI